jgi:putative nucleotidyltransferase with HDIG domain
MKRSVISYVTAIVALNIVATVAVAFVATPPSRADWTAAAFFAAMGLIATLLSYERSGAPASGSVSFLPFLGGVLVSPTLATIIAVSVSTVVAYLALRKPVAKVLFNASQYGLATTAAVLVLMPVGPLLSRNFGTLRAMLFGVSALTFLAVNTLLVVGVIALAERKFFWQTWRKVVSSTLLFDVLGLPMVALLGLSYIQLGKGWLAAIVLPLLCLRLLYKKNAEAEQTAEDLLQIMVYSVEVRDPYTSGHSRRVATYSRIIARIARMPAKSVERIGTAALLHDVGKIHNEFVPILAKAGRLTDEERQIIDTHPVKSAEMVQKVGRLRDLVPTVRAHHERWDGRGYPDGLAGQDIPIGARVIALADTIDAMMSSRPYRAALTIADIKKEVERGRGSQFDPGLADALLADTSWLRLTKAIRRFQALRPGETIDADDVEYRRTTGDMPIVAVR